MFLLTTRHEQLQLNATEKYHFVNDNKYYVETRVDKR